MTETTTFPFSSLHEEATESDDQRRPLAAILGGGLLAVVLVGGAVFAFTGGDEQLPVSAGVSSTVTGAGVAPPPDAELTETVPAANTESITRLRNPFEPKYIAPAPVVEAPPDSPATDPATDPAAVPPSTVVVEPDLEFFGPAPADGGTAAPTTPGTPAPAPVAPREYRLVLTGVSTDGGVPTASFTIDGAVSTVKATEIFGPQRQLLLRSLQQGPADGQWTATIQVGDARPIDVVTGEAVYVQ